MYTRNIFQVFLLTVNFVFYGYTQAVQVKDIVPQNLIVPPEAVTETSVTLLWDKPPQYANVNEYDIFMNGAYLSSSAITNYTASNLHPNKKYTFTIKAKTSAGQTSLPCNKLKVETKSKGKVFNVLDFGAQGDGSTLNTLAIQKAINACTNGGTVYIPEGKFLSGALFLKSNMTFYIAKGGILKGSTVTKEYLPMILNRFEGWELQSFASLLNAGKLDRNGSYNVKNLTISGAGTISGGGSVLGDAMSAEKGIRSRGRLILLMNAQNINIQGLTIEEPPCWTIHYVYSDNVTLHDLNISSKAKNGDGIDPDSSTDSFIFNCSFSTNDDCIAIKSGKNPEGYYVGKPTENVYITNCNFIEGHGISIGSEMSGGVRNVIVRDCKAGNLRHGMQIKGTKERGGFVEKVIVKDCDLLKITIFSNVGYNNDGEPAPVQPYYKDFEFSNINMTKANTKDAVIIAEGFSNNYTKNVVFKNIILPKNSEIKLSRCNNFVFENVLDVNKNKPNYKIETSTNIRN